MKRRGKVRSREAADGESSDCLFQSVDWRGARQAAETGITLKVQRQQGCQLDLQCWSSERALKAERMEDGVEWLRSRGTCQGRWGKARAQMKHLSPKHWA